MEARISAGLALALWPWSEPQFLICRVGQLIPAVSTVQRTNAYKAPGTANFSGQLHRTLTEIHDFSSQNMSRGRANDMVLPHTSEASGGKNSLQMHQK